MAGRPPSLHARVKVDHGTSARIDTPGPGLIGLHHKPPHAAKTTQASLGQRIVTYARARIGTKHGDGECTTLVEDALKAARAKRAEDFGAVSADSDYIWGTKVSLANVHPGDVIQFRDYRFDKTVVTVTRTATVIRTDTDTAYETRPHHTAIVEKVDGDGALTVLEQNVEESPVKRSTLFFKDFSKSSGGQTTTVKVQGKFWFYRPHTK